MPRPRRTAAARRVPRKRVAPKRRARAAPLPRRRLVRQGMPVAGVLAAVDATQRLHVPPPFPMGPYTVMRSRTTRELTTVGGDIVILLGAHSLSDQPQSNITPLLGVYGTGTAVPGVAADEYVILDSVLNAYATTAPASNAMASLHALTVTVSCAGAATYAAGSVYVGVLNQRIRRAAYPTYTALSDALKARQELSSHSALALTAGIKVSDYPVDVVDWAAQHALFSNVAGPTSITKDSLGQVVVILGPNSAGVPYLITVYTEWRINFNDAALSATATKRPVTSTGVWDQVVAAGTATNGNFDSLANGATGQPRTLGRIGDMNSAPSRFSAAKDVYNFARQAYTPLNGMLGLARQAGFAVPWTPDALPALFGD